MKNCIGIVSANYNIEGIAPLTNNRALASLPFGGRYRLIDFPLSNFANAKITTASIIIPHNNRSLVEHVGTGKEWGFGYKLGGLFLLPGSVFGSRLISSRFLLRDLENNSNFLTRDTAKYVIMCGSNKIFNMDMKELIEYQKKSPAKMTLVYKKMLYDGIENNLYLQFDENGLVKKIKKKGTGVVNHFLDCMIIEREYLLDILNWYEVFGDMDVIELIGEHIDEFMVDSFEFSGYVGDINNGNQYMKANMDLLDNAIRNELFNQDRKIYTNIQDKSPTKYGKNAIVKNSLIAGGCVIEGTVENCIVFRSSTIKPGAVVKNSILMQHCVAGRDTRLDNIICDKNVEINESVHIAGGIHKPFIIEKGRIL